MKPEPLVELEALEVELEELEELEELADVEELEELVEPEEVDDVEELPDELAEGTPVPPHPENTIVNSRTDNISIVFMPLPFSWRIFCGAINQCL